MLIRVGTGEASMVTRDGVEVEELRPLPRRPPSGAQLIGRRRALPPRTIDWISVRGRATDDEDARLSIKRLRDADAG